MSIRPPHRKNCRKNWGRSKTSNNVPQIRESIKGQAFTATVYCSTPRLTARCVIWKCCERPFKKNDFLRREFPWFATLCGRDSMITALQTLAFHPDIAADTLRLLARYQGGSALTYRGIPLQSAYCGAKHAIQGFTKSVRITMVQMPALNPPQFDWVKSRLPRKPQPVPPIYQPKVAAEAIIWAAHHNRRELNVGTITSIVVEANKVVPAFGDWYLAKTGYDSQQYDGAANPNRRDNLWEPVPSDWRAW